MANLSESATWETGIYQLEETDPVQGGQSGIDNLQGKQLANRTKYLKQEVEAAQSANAAHAANANPHPQYATDADLAAHVAAADPHPQYTTAAELTAALAGSGFASGTRLAFAQATAPTGWTQDTSDAADNRMLRVVKIAGGSVAGTHSPIFNNVVPAHTHTFTTGQTNTDHVHAAGTDAQGSHAHAYPTGGVTGSGHPVLTNGQGGWGNTEVAGSHAHNVSIGYMSVNASHAHSGGTDNGSSQTNWQPRYIDLIICSKN